MNEEMKKTIQKFMDMMKELDSQYKDGAITFLEWYYRHQQLTQGLNYWVKKQETKIKNAWWRELTPLERQEFFDEEKEVEKFMDSYRQWRDRTHPFIG